MYEAAEKGSNKENKYVDVCICFSLNTVLRETCRNVDLTFLTYNLLSFINVILLKRPARPTQESFCSHDSPDMLHLTLDVG